MSKRIRILVVDDSALVRKVITESLAKDPDIEVVGTAMDPYIARDKILQLNPDVITLDIEMPRMDGITFLRLIMKHRPMPVIIFSSLTQDGSAKALEALQAGAVDVLAKPGGSFTAYEDGSKLAEKIKAAAVAKIRPGTAPIVTPAPGGTAASLTSLQPGHAAFSAPSPHRSDPVQKFKPTLPPPKAPVRGRSYNPKSLILLGASTGGTEALKEVLTHLPADMPPICVVQHIPAYFSTAFANRLNELSQIEVREAKQGDRLQPGLALIAPGGYHLVVRWMATHYQVDLSTGPMVHHQRPAVDILFDSAVKAGAGPYSLAVIMTGMGADGASGLLKLRESGSQTIAQNEDTCVVFGMPREAIRLGAAMHVQPLDQIALSLDRFASRAAIG